MSSVLVRTEANPITPGECQALVDRVAASVELRRATRLRSFLLYVCDRALNHGSSVIPEQEIGGAVFGRPPGYDTGIDNIVRVNATELRKRLEHYFSEEGAGEEIVLELQRGSYSPVFRRRHVDPAAGVEAVTPQPEPAFREETAAPTETTPAEPVPVAVAVLDEPVAAAQTPRPKLTRWRSAAVVILLPLLALSCLWLLWQNHTLAGQLQPWTRDPSLRAFWGNFFNSATDTDILLADTSFAISEDMMHQSISLSDYLNYNYKRFAESPSLSAGQRDDLRLVLERNNGSIADFRVGQQIMALDFGPRRATLRFAREYTPDAAKHHSLVLIGSRQSNPWVDLFARNLNFDLRYDPQLGRPYIVNRVPRSGEQAIYPPPANTDPANTSYAVIAYVPGAIGKGNALIIEGCDSQATGAAGDFITGEDSLAQLEKKFSGGQIPPFEVLLRTSQIIGTPLHSEVIASRVYPGSGLGSGLGAAAEKPVN